MSKKEVKKIVTQIIKKTGADSIKDLGKIMGIIMKELAGKVDGKLIQELVKKELHS